MCEGMQHAAAELGTGGGGGRCVSNVITGKKNKVIKCSKFGLKFKSNL